MVIDHALFDYRERLLVKFMEKHGLSQKSIEKWVSVDELFRYDIVKNRPRGRVVDNIELPADGFDSIELSVGTLCDGCHRELSAGDWVNYHLRTGHVFCSACAKERK